MLGIDTKRVIEPLTMNAREPAPPTPTGSLEVEPVPEAARPQPTPLIRLIMPLVMIVAVIGIVVVMVVGAGADGGGGAGGGSQLSPMMLMFPMMMLVTVFTMFNPQGPGKDQDETRRTYLRHLNGVRDEALANARAQRAHDTHQHPAPSRLAPLVNTGRLWERAAGDPDALEVRVGTGPAALATPINVPEAVAIEDLDPVCAVSLRHLLKAVGTVADMPVVIQLQAFRFIGLAGPHARELARAMVLQLVTFHGPEAVGISFLGHGWGWLKWLPHTRCPEDAAFHILIVDDVATTGVEPFIDDPAYTTIIDVGSRRTTALGVRAEHEGLCLLVESDGLHVVTAAGDEEIGVADSVGAHSALSFARSLASLQRPLTTSSTHHGPAGGDLLRLLGMTDIADHQGLWPGLSESQRLNVPIGTTPDGVPVKLDLKESAHGGMGPHGLCIGATGSGKSELLKTLVTALAITHSPEELNFVLVDFKGGATFLGCDQLPHTSAVITNLENEAVLVERMFDAISGEMNRRQEVLRRAGNFANVGDYNAARRARLDGGGHAGGREAGDVRDREGEDLGPLPALVIVVDEFSELLGQHPDFADLFVAVGRLGRSLHVHLLLASQRLEEGRLRGLDSHLSYRIGLKTFSAAESRQVLGVTDAYNLPAQPGAGYLKTDAEQLARFQASYVSGPLARMVETLPGHGEDSGPGAIAEGGATGENGRGEVDRGAVGVRLFTGWDEPQVTEGTTQRVLDTSTTLLTEVVDITRQAAAERDFHAHRLWLPPLPRVIQLPEVVGPVLAEHTGSALKQGTGTAATSAAALCLRVPVGIIDKPYYQRQDPLWLDLGTEGGHAVVCGGPQAGKSTALRSIVASLAALNSPDNVRFYVIDLGGGQLATLERLPHVAAVASRYEPEKIRRIVDEVQVLVAEPEPRHTIVVIDGWHHIGTAGADFEDLVQPLTELAADGPSARIHFVVSTPRWTTMRPAIRDLMSHRLELRLGEAMDSLIDRKAQQKLPALPGRGITQAGEFMLIAHSSNQDLAHICHTAEARGWQPVPALKMLPHSVNTSELVPEEHAPSALAFGIGGQRLRTQYWDPDTSAHLVAVGSSESGKSTLLATLMEGICRRSRKDARLVVIDHRRVHLGTLDEDMVAAYSATSASTSAVLRDASVTLSARLPGPDVTASQLADRSWWQGPDIYIVIDDFELVSDAALAPLVELVPHARDIGMHIIIARKAGGFGRALFAQFLAAVRDSQPAVLLFDADKEEGPIFGLKPTAQPPGRARWSIRGELVGLCHVAQPARTSPAIAPTHQES